MVPYMAFVWGPIYKLLDDYAIGAVSHADLWTSALVIIAQTLACDEGGLGTICVVPTVAEKVAIAFWREDKTRQLVPALVKQIPVCVQFHSSQGRTALVDCLVATMEAVNDDALLKKMNIDVLMHTRSEEASVRLLSLTCSAALWKAHGGKLLGKRPLRDHDASFSWFLQVLWPRLLHSSQSARRTTMIVLCKRRTISRTRWKA